MFFYRNCLVTEIQSKSLNDRFYVQISDNALSRDLFPEDYHCLGDNENRAIKWMAPEALRRNVHNSASDVVRLLSLKDQFTSLCYWGNVFVSITRLFTW